MNSSWNLGKIFGIDIKIHLTFFFLLIWVGFTALFNGGTTAEILLEIGFILALFLSVVLHELGHALMARRFGIPTRDITLLPIGGVARLERIPEDSKEEFLVAIAGPAVNVLIAGLIFAVALISGTFSQASFSITAFMNNFWLRLMSVNLTLVFFNLIPAFPMDGGRVLRSLLSSKVERVKATRIAANIGRGFAVILGITGFFTNPWLVLTAIFIWFGAGAEADAVQMKSELQGLSVRDALVSQFYQVEGNQSLGNVFQLAIQTGQRYIPVTSNGHFLGFIAAANLGKAIQRYGERAPAYAAIDREPEAVHPDLPLQNVLEKLGTNRILPVIEDRQLMGFITPESVQQRMLLNRQMRKDTPSNSEKTDPVQ
jgi:Zn-dependent protease